MEGRASEDLVERWLRGAGFAPERFPLRRRRLGKTPDFRVVPPAGDPFLVEVKTLTSVAPGHGAVAFKLVRARAQFDAVNQGGRLANVLALVSADIAALIGPLRDLAGGGAEPLLGLDLVLGFATTRERVTVLHADRRSRHLARLDRCGIPVNALDPAEQKA